MVSDIECRDDHLYVTSSGLFNHRSLPEMMKEIFVAGAKYKQRKILLDIRPLQGEISLLARYEFGTIMADLQRDPIEIAVLGRNDQIWPDRFAENVANNRGVRTKVITDMAEAAEWLKVKLQAKPSAESAAS
jgi:hypothetical protein